MLPYWYDAIIADLAAGRTPLVVAHGNSLRALVKHLDGISDADIAELNIPTGMPLVYELDDAVPAGAARRAVPGPARPRRRRPRPSRTQGTARPSPERTPRSSGCSLRWCLARTIDMDATSRLW